jgi:hypothetical protein
MSRSDDDPNVFLVNDFQDPLQVCCHTPVFFWVANKPISIDIRVLFFYHYFSNKLLILVIVGLCTKYLYLFVKVFLSMAVAMNSVFLYPL